jgi:tetratricopeptide (TPR) repeat protein
LVGTGDLEGAKGLYAQALAQEPSFVSCLSNRAAVHMAQGDLRACVEDCDAALACLEAAQDEGGLSGVPPPASDKRRAWVVRTLARRGAAHTALGDLGAARGDYQTALRITPGDEKLLKDLAAIEERAGGAQAQAQTPASE